MHVPPVMAERLRDPSIYIAHLNDEGLLTDTNNHAQWFLRLFKESAHVRCEILQVVSVAGLLAGG